MIQRLGEIVGRSSTTVAVLWVALWGVLAVSAPTWSSLIQDDQFAYLRPESPSREAEAVFRRAFPPPEVPTTALKQSGRTRPRPARLQDPLKSNLVIVVRRKDRPEASRDGLQPRDFEFIEEQLRPRLEQIAQTARRTPAGSNSSELIVQEVLTPDNQTVGPLLESDNDESALVVLELRSDYLEPGNEELITRIERMLADAELKRIKPGGLDLVLSGSAVVGRDVQREESATLRRMEFVTLGVLFVLLALACRAPVVALLAVGVLFLSTRVIVDFVGLMAGWGWVQVYTGLLIQLQAVTYTSGTLFTGHVISDYRRRLDRGLNFAQAMDAARSACAPGLLACAVIAAGVIATLTAAEFGKLREAGRTLPLALVIAWLAAVTLLPAVLKLVSPVAFWPDLRRERISATSGWLPTIRLAPLDWPAQWRRSASRWVGEVIQRRGGVVLAASLALLALPATYGILHRHNVSYGLLNGLPETEPSVIGLKAVQGEFHDGMTGTTTILVRHQGTGADAVAGQSRAVAGAMTTTLWSRRDVLNLADVRSEAHPWGMSERAKEIPLTIVRGSMVGLRTILPADGGIARNRLINKRAHEAYTSTADEGDGHIMRFDLVFNTDPFAVSTMDNLSLVEAAMRHALPEEHRNGASILALGPTASLRDLKLTTREDSRTAPGIAVLVAVVLTGAALRRPVLSVYLVGCVFVVCLASIGLTRGVFSLSGEAAALDWRAPSLALILSFALGLSFVLEGVQGLGVRRRQAHAALDRPSALGGPSLSTYAAAVTCFGALMTSHLAGLVQIGLVLSLSLTLNLLVVRSILWPAWRVLCDGEVLDPSITRATPPGAHRGKASLWSDSNASIGGAAQADLVP